MVEVNHMMSSDLHPCSGFKRRRICLPFLPKEIIFKILLCLPMDILYNVMRYVCREWYNIIEDPKFIDAHLRETTATGFLIQIPSQYYSTLYLEMGEHGVEITDLNLFPEGMRDGKGFNWFQPPSQSWQYKERIFCSNESLKFPSRVLASCKGLVLVSDKNFDCFHVANPVSRQWVSLPPLIRKPRFLSGAGLGYADSCKAYKVAHIYTSCVPDYQCAVLTLGVDKTWRSITSSNHMSCIPQEAHRHMFSAESYSTGGYVHWASSTCVLSLDVETESFHVSAVPNECYAKFNFFLELENYLSFASGWQDYIYDLWALVDVETGHWKKMQKIDLTAQIPVIEQHFGLSIFTLTPAGLLKNGELFILRVCTCEFMIYNVKTGAIDYFLAGSRAAPPILRCQPFIKSFVSPKLEMKVL